MIDVRQLSKTYRVPIKEPGLSGSLRGLFVRRYRDVHAVADVSFKIEQGERVGFLGPNGAGKTTTLQMLLGILSPTSGSIKVFDFIESLEDSINFIIKLGNFYFIIVCYI